MYLRPHGNDNMFTDLLLTHESFVTTTLKFTAMESYRLKRTVRTILFLPLPTRVCVFIHVLYKIPLYTCKENQLGMEE